MQNRVKNFESFEARRSRRQKEHYLIARKLQILTEYSYGIRTNEFRPLLLHEAQWTQANPEAVLPMNRDLIVRFLTLHEENERNSLRFEA